MSKEKIIEQRERWQKDPVDFVRVVFKAEPTEQQAQILNAVAGGGSRVSAKSGHGTGKTTTLAWLIWWHVLLFSDSKTPCTAPTSAQLKSALWAELSKWKSQAHPWFKSQMELTSEEAFLRDKKAMQFAVARTATKDNPESLQGFHATNLMFVIDEASGVDEAVFEVVEGALSTPGARVVMMSNPTRTNGYFYRSHHKDRERWKRFTLSCIESPRVAREYISGIASAYGEDSDFYKVRVKGDFPSSSVAQLIPLHTVNEAMSRKLNRSQYAFAPKVLGVDVAWEGDDCSCVFLRQGLLAKCLGTYNVDTVELASIVARFEDEHKTDATFIDAGAMGPGTIDNLRHIGREPIPINFGSKAIRPEFANKRAEMWCGVRDWLKDGGCVYEDEELREDLVGPEFSYRLSDSALILEAKKDMKKRGLASPDRADALALTFAMTIMPSRVEAGVKIDSEYKLF